jgi:DNA-binding NtrC family response regulator
VALILVVDDEPGIREVLRAGLTDDGHRVLVATSGEEALTILTREVADLVITDLSMPGIDGVELLRRASKLAPDLPAIVITAFGSKQSAIDAMRHGAVNYLEKPFDVEEMRLHVRRALRHARLSEENRRLRAQVSAETELTGNSAAIQTVRQMIARVAGADSTVLITGESGTGKEIVARAIHRLSVRAERPFVGINCAAIPADLLESELFGHIRGSFTGADRTRRGLVEAAEGGTLFLDEIGDMPAEMQAKLLRVLQERSIRRVGGNEEITVDVRVIAATHRDLHQLVRQDRFREDLFYRIHVIHVRVPPLRERPEDIDSLCANFMQRHAARMNRKVQTASEPFLAALRRYHWPGNVRQLENTIERAVALSSSDQLEVETLPPEIHESQVPGSAALPEQLPALFDLEAHLEQQRLHYMRLALKACHGVQTRAAERLAMTFRSFRYFAKKYALGGRVSESDLAEAAEDR